MDLVSDAAGFNLETMDVTSDAALLNLNSMDVIYVLQSFKTSFFNRLMHIYAIIICISM